MKIDNEKLRQAFVGGLEPLKLSGKLHNLVVAVFDRATVVAANGEEPQRRMRRKKGEAQPNG